MKDDFSTSPSHIFAAMGPCIRACCYTVGAEVAGHFAQLFPEWEPLPEGRGRSVDLPEANRRQMTSAGVDPERIFDSGLCTTCQADQFYSFRREPENEGRMIAAIERLS
jgi:copper oxidase (laccase) domain-containing protein